MFQITAIEPAPRQAKITLPSLIKDRDYVLLWYGPNTRSRTAGDVPRLIVWFCEFHAGGVLGSRWSQQEIAMTFLGQLRIGSIWRNGISTHQLKLATHHFIGSYTANQWSATTSVKSAGQHLIPPDEYPLPYPKSDHSRLLRFSSKGHTLLVPCMEFFARCYGRSDEVNRILITYDPNEASERLMLQEPVEIVPGARSVWIPRYTSSSDGHLLAQLRHDRASWLKVMSIQAQLDQELRRNGRPFAFVPIGPWYYGSAQLKVEGVQLSTGDFLGLRIIGHSLPEEPDIKAFYEKIEQKTDGEVGSFAVPRREIKEVPEGQTTPTTEFSAGDCDTDIYVIKDPSIVILGRHAEITSNPVTRDRGRATARVPSSDSEISAPGETNGTGKEVSQLRAQSAAILESQGSVRDLWNGLIYLKKQNASVIKSVRWYHPVYKFNTEKNTDHEYIRLPNFKHDHPKFNDTLNWLNRASLPGPRGAFIVQVKTPSVTGYLFEIQRGTKKNEKDGSLTEIDKLCGLAAVPPMGEDVDVWIRDVLGAIAFHKGIISNVLSDIKFSGGDAYKRSTKNNDKTAGQATAFLALKKLGIQGLRYESDNPSAAP